MIRRPPRSTPFPTRRSSDLHLAEVLDVLPDARHLGRRGAARHPHVHHGEDRKSTRLNSSHVAISYAVFCLKKKKKNINTDTIKTKTIIESYTRRNPRQRIVH